MDEHNTNGVKKRHLGQNDPEPSPNTKKARRSAASPNHHHSFRELPEQEHDLNNLLINLLMEASSSHLPNRELAIQRVIDHCKENGPTELLTQILPLLSHPELEPPEVDLLAETLQRSLHALLSSSSEQGGNLICPFIAKILAGVKPLLMDVSPSLMEGREIISILCKLCGAEAVLSVIITMLSNNPNEHTRDAAARVLGMAAFASGVPAVLPTVREFCASKYRWRLYDTGLKAVEQMAIVMGPTLEPHLEPLIEAVRDCINFKDLRVFRSVVLSVAALADAAASFEPFEVVWDSYLSYFWLLRDVDMKEDLVALFRMYCSVLPLINPEHDLSVRGIGDFMMCLVGIMRNCGSVLLKGDEDAVLLALRLILQCCSFSRYLPYEFLGCDKKYGYGTCSYVLKGLWGGPLTHFLLGRRDCHKLLLNATSAVAEVLGGVAGIRKAVILQFRGHSKEYKLVVTGMIEKALEFSSCFSDALLDDLIAEIKFLFTSSCRLRGARVPPSKFAGALQQDE